MRVNVTHVQRRGWNLVAVALVVVGLAISAPPTSVAFSGDHIGALVHPIFPHVHGDGHTYATDDPRADLASHEPASGDVAPGLSVPLSQTAGREAAAGLVLPFALAILVLELSRRRRLHEPLLLGRPISPPTPPPRMPASIS